MYPNQFDTKNSICVKNNKIIKITKADEKRFKLLKKFSCMFVVKIFVEILQK
jgi:hypothetical protein